VKVVSPPVPKEEWIVHEISRDHKRLYEKWLKFGRETALAHDVDSPHAPFDVSDRRPGYNYILEKKNSYSSEKSDKVYRPKTPYERAVKRSAKLQERWKAEQYRKDLCAINLRKSRYQAEYADSDFERHHRAIVENLGVHPQSYFANLPDGSRDRSDFGKRWDMHAPICGWHAYDRGIAHEAQVNEMLVRAAEQMFNFGISYTAYF